MAVVAVLVCMTLVSCDDDDDDDGNNGTTTQALDFSNTTWMVLYNDDPYLDDIDVALIHFTTQTVGYFTSSEGQEFDFNYELDGYKMKITVSYGPEMDGTLTDISNTDVEGEEIYQFDYTSDGSSYVLQFFAWNY